MSSSLRGALCRIAAVTALVALGALDAGDAFGSGSVRGSVRLELAGLRLADAGAIVVFLKSLDSAASEVESAAEPREVRQRGARFEPRFLAVSVGQPVVMPNDDVIYHNVFSYSAPNDFDLGLYAAGESRTLRFAEPGVVRFYCSIHEGMDGVLFVAPSRLFATPDGSGRYAIEDVPPGRYRVEVWSARVPGAWAEADVADASSTAVDLVLGASD